jgi:hypothetical protein
MNTSTVDILKFIYHSVPFEIWVVLFWAFVFAIYIGIHLLVIYLIGRGDQNEDINERNKSD